MDKQGCVRAIAGFQGEHLLFQESDLFRFPHVILVAQEDIISFRLADQGKEVSGGTQVLTLFSAKNKTAVSSCCFLKQAGRAVC